MKYKADILLSQNHKYIVMLPIQKKRNTHYLLKTPTNQLVVQPYLNTEDETIKIGRELASILTIKQYEEIEVEPFTGEILSLETLYLKIKQPFDHSKLSNLEYINSLDTKQFEIDLGDDVYKMENTIIYYSNCDLKKVYGHKNDITSIQKLAYGSLFCKNEINGFNLKQSNVMIVKGNKKLRLNDIMHNVAHNLHANYYFMPTDVQSIPSENIMYVYEFDESSIFSTIHNVKKYEQDNVLFVFLVNDDEHKDKLLAYFDTSLSYDVSVPVAKRDGKLLKELLCEIPHKINEKEMRSLVSYLCNKNLFEIEDIITRVLSKANYEKRFDMKTGGCFVVFSDFMEVFEKLQKTKTTGLFASARQWIRKRFL